ncbi:MAG: GNAT family N-acetyltransferase [Chloroflexi bacterium]|nr:GNAT family N-acetyltransferase [Chloroflexota bacterium]
MSMREERVRESLSTSSIEDVVVRGSKVVLRRKRLEDASDDYSWRTDDELARLDAASPLKMSFPEYVRYYGSTDSWSPWSRQLAIDTLDGNHIGNCMYYDIDTVRGETEIGIMIGDRHYWNRGYGTDAVRALLEHVFTTTDLRRVYLHTLEWNVRAQRSFLKSGFTRVKLTQRDGQTFVQMELWRGQWERYRRERFSGTSADGVGQAHSG